MKSIILIAPPAAGKGTEAAILKERYNIPHISTGDLLRKASEEKTEEGLEIKEQLEKGNLVEDEIVVKVGEVEHPMEKEHYIMWIAQVSENRTTRVRLYPEQATETRFPYIPGATLYAYCNKHGLWKTIVE